MSVKKNIQWNEVTRELLEEHLMTQMEIADRCKVSQKAVSCWLNSVNAPSKYAQKELRKLINEFKIEIGSTGKEGQKINSELDKIYKTLSTQKQKELLRFARFLQSE